jgi:uncharacterized protein (TIGR03000 family)
VAAPASDEKKGDKKSAMPFDKATVIVALPADAALYVDGRRLEFSAATREVVTPVLEANTDYYYMVKTAVIRDGMTVEQVKRVNFRAGQLVRVNMEEASPAVRTAASGARVTVRLPEDARLTINGVPCALTAGVRSFDVPELEPGRLYHYTLNARVQRDGRARSETRQIVFEAGAEVDVDFRTPAPVATARK